jgi:hypothetical protein
LNLKTCSLAIDESVEQDHEVKDVGRMLFKLLLVNERAKTVALQQTATKKVVIEGKMTVSF